MYSADCSGCPVWFWKANALTAQSPVILLPTSQAHAEPILSALGECSDSFLLAGFDFTDWNGAYSPWPAASLAKGQEPFSGQAVHTLHWLQKEFLPLIRKEYGVSAAPSSTGMVGYSLAGLFAVWALYTGKLFHAVASCSGSLWYEGFSEWLGKQHAPAGTHLYFSLGKAEEKAKNAKLAAVGEQTRYCFEIVQKDPHVLESTLVWHKGGHFSAVPVRQAQAIHWLLAHMQKSHPEAR